MWAVGCWLLGGGGGGGGGLCTLYVVLDIINNNIPLPLHIHLRCLCLFLVFVFVSHAWPVCGLCLGGGSGSDLGSGG